MVHLNLFLWYCHSTDKFQVLEEVHIFLNEHFDVHIYVIIDSILDNASYDTDALRWFELNADKEQ